MAKLLSDNTANELLRVIGRRSAGGMGGKVRRHSGRGGGSSIKYFVLAEDAAGNPVMFWEGELIEGSGAIVPREDAEVPLELHYWLSVLSSPKQAKAGYAGIYSTDTEGRNVFVAGPCVSGCQTDSSISPGEPMDGEVDVPYEHTVGVTGLGEDGISASGLPPGLAIDSETGEITGTPTQAGEYWVTLTGDSDDDPPCPITRIVRIVIGGGDGGWQLDPDPEEPPPDPEPPVP